MLHTRTRAGGYRALGLTIAAGLVSASFVAPAQAVSMTFSGKLVGSSASQIGKVILLTSSGRGLASNVASNGTFSISTSKAIARNGSLQLIGKNGRYFGPVVLKVDTFKKKHQATKYFGHTILTGEKAALGNIAVNAGWGKASAKKTVYTSSFITLLTSSGKPKGAGNAGKTVSSRPAKPSGFKPTGSAVASTPGAIASGSAGTNAVDPLAQTATGDPDGDGIPNTMDVADSPTSLLDIVNPALNQNGALIPWVDLRLGASEAKNFHSNGVTTDDIAEFIGGNTNKFTVAYFIDQRSITGENDYLNLDFSYIDCAALVYCANDPSATSTVSTFSGSTAWRTFAGSTYGENNVTVPGDVPDATQAPYNGLSRMLRSDDHCPHSLCPYWTAGMHPETGVANTLSVFKPGDVYTVHGVKGTTDIQVPMLLSPFAVTVPTIASALPTSNNTNLSGEDLTVGDDGHVTFDVYRPQRLTVAGESGDFMDLAGMHYGIILGVVGANKNEFGCSPDWYSLTGSGLEQKANYNADNLADNLWPLTDSTALDIDPASLPTQTLHIDLNLAGCLSAIASDTAAYHSWGEKVTPEHPLVSLSEQTKTLSEITGVTSGSLNFMINLVAAGEFVTGGANRATLGMRTTFTVPAS